MEPREKKIYVRSYRYQILHDFTNILCIQSNQENHSMNDQSRQFFLKNNEIHQYVRNKKINLHIFFYK